MPFNPFHWFREHDSAFRDGIGEEPGSSVEQREINLNSTVTIGRYPGRLGAKESRI